MVFHQKLESHYKYFQFINNLLNHNKQDTHISHSMTFPFFKT